MTNTQTNLSNPLLYHLRQEKDRDERIINNELVHKEQADARDEATNKFDTRIAELRNCFIQLRDVVVVSRAKMFDDETKELTKTLQEEIDGGDTTNAYEMYKRIIADNELRKYPYYFEIEMKVVDSLNSLLKKRFRNIVRTQVGDVADKLTERVRAQLDALSEDVGYDSSVVEGLAEVLADSREHFLNQVDGVVTEKASNLDELLVYKRKGFRALFAADNNIITGLERAAQMHADEIKDAGQAVSEKAMDAKTDQIRSTLRDHYLKQTDSLRNEIAGAVWQIVRNQMLKLETDLTSRLSGKYRTLLEEVMRVRVSEEYKKKRTEYEDRTMRFRKAIESIQDSSEAMQVSLKS